MVQMDKVAQIARGWEAAGRPRCDHSRADKEYYLGSQTGDMACLGCGETWGRGSPAPPPSGDDPGPGAD